MSLTLKISAVSMTIVAFAVSLLIFLSYYKYESLLNGLIRSRFQVVADDLKNTVSYGMSLGIALNELQTTQNVIKNIKDNDEQILSIKVFGLDAENVGRTIYNTRNAGIGGEIPRQWIATMGVNKIDDSWFLQEDEANVMGLNIVDQQLARSVGGIAVRYSQDYESIRQQKMLKSMLFNALIVIAIVGFSTFIGCYLFFYPISKSFARINNYIEYFIEENSWTKFDAKTELEKNFQLFFNKYDQAYDELRETRKDLA